MTIGKGTHRTVPVELLGAVAGALSRSGNAENTLVKVRAALEEDDISAQFAGFMAFGRDNGKVVPLPGYASLSEISVKNMILHAARREGYKGTVAGRMLELGWWIEPVYRRTP